jgi:hypothetical protein
MTRLKRKDDQVMVTGRAETLWPTAPYTNVNRSIASASNSLNPHIEHPTVQIGDHLTLLVENELLKYLIELHIPGWK